MLENSSPSKIVQSQTVKDEFQANIKTEAELDAENAKILCLHCQRTATNGIKCKGICVADDGY